MPALSCPRCQLPLARTQTPQGVAFPCPTCSGRAVMVDQIRRSLSPARFAELWDTLKLSPNGTLPCPLCSSPMRVVWMSGLEIDTCVQCSVIWLDAGEEEALAGPPAPAPAPQPAPVSTNPTLPPGTYRMVTHPEHTFLTTIDQLPAVQILGASDKCIAELRRVHSNAKILHAIIGHRTLFIPRLKQELSWRYAIELRDKAPVMIADTPMWPGSPTWINYGSTQYTWRYTSLLRMQQALLDGKRALAEMERGGVGTTVLKTYTPLDVTLVVFVFCLRWGMQSYGSIDKGEYSYHESE